MIQLSYTYSFDSIEKEFLLTTSIYLGGILMNKLNDLRAFMKSPFNLNDDDENYELSDQEKKLPQPPLEKPYDNSLPSIHLPEVTQAVLQNSNILDIINRRQSWRSYSEESITLEELSFLLWCSQGVKKVTANNYATLRTVPSGGARHPFETYLIINNIDSLKKGIYRYLALSHSLILLKEGDFSKEAAAAALNQNFLINSAVVFIWTCIPYRGEWRYLEAAHKVMLLDSGHVCQNLYLACDAVNCGTCGVAAYDQSAMDKLLGIDGTEEFTVYLAPVGKIK